MKVSEAALTDYLRRVGEALADSGMRATTERMAIARAVAQAGMALTVADIRRTIEAQVAVSVATIYNTLRLFEGLQLVRAQRVGSRGAYMAVVQPNTVRAVCQHCGRESIVKSDTELTQMLLGRRYGSFVPDAFTLQIFGLCGRCGRKAKQK